MTNMINKTVEPSSSKLNKGATEALNDLSFIESIEGSSMTPSQMPVDSREQVEDYYQFVDPRFAIDGFVSFSYQKFERRARAQELGRRIKGLRKA